MLTAQAKNLITEAPKIWSHLNGIINIYKPAGISMHRVQAMVAANICRGLLNLQNNIFSLFTLNFKHFRFESDESEAAQGDCQD
jgi:hypothetical protein